MTQLTQSHVLLFDAIAAKCRGVHRSCFGKIAYPTFWAANRVVKQAVGRESNRRRRSRGGGKLDVYRCKVCHDWHIGGGVWRP